MAAFPQFSDQSGTCRLLNSKLNADELPGLMELLKDPSACARRNAYRAAKCAKQYLDELAAQADFALSVLAACVRSILRTFHDSVELQTSVSK